MNRPLYQIDEVGKALLTALKTCGRHKSFTEILELIGAGYNNEKQADLANTLEALGLIGSVTYRLPFEVRAELSPTGLKLVSRMEVDEKKAGPS